MKIIALVYYGVANYYFNHKDHEEGTRYTKLNGIFSCALCVKLCVPCGYNFKHYSKLEPK